MRIANLLFASAAFADKNIDQLTKKVRFSTKIRNFFFSKILKIFREFFETFFGMKMARLAKKSLILISQETIKQ